MGQSTRHGRTTLTAIASDLSLSICTVSRILNNKMGRTRYADATIRRVRQAAAKAGYQPNAVARSLVTGRSRTIGLCVADIANPHFAAFAAAFENRTASVGIQTFICNTAEDAAQEHRLIQALLSRQVDSIVLSPTFGEASLPLLETAWGRGCRVIVFDRPIAGLGAHSVLTDNRQAMRTLCEQCLAQGHRTVGLIAGDDRDPTIRERLRAVSDAVASAGLSREAVCLASDAIRASTSIADGHRQMMDLLTRSPRPTLFLSLANLLSIGALRAVRSMGLRAGRDFSFAAFDDFPGSELLDPAITLMAQPVRAMAEACADFACAENRSTGESVVIASTLHWRGSVTAP